MGARQGREHGNIRAMEGSQRFCENCGSEVGPAARFCGSCGHAVHATTAQDASVTKGRTERAAEATGEHVALVAIGQAVADRIERNIATVRVAAPSSLTFGNYPCAHIAVRSFTPAQKRIIRERYASLFDQIADATSASPPIEAMQFQIGCLGIVGIASAVALIDASVDSMVKVASGSRRIPNLESPIEAPALAATISSVFDDRWFRLRHPRIPRSDTLRTPVQAYGALDLSMKGLAQQLASLALEFARSCYESVPGLPHEVYAATARLGVDVLEGAFMAVTDPKVALSYSVHITPDATL